MTREKIITLLKSMVEENLITQEACIRIIAKIQEVE